jgi:uncharacterized protein
VENALLIDIDHLPREGLRLARNFDFPSMDLIENSAVFLEPTKAEVFIRLVGEEVFVQGRITARLSFVCSRCLTPFEFPVDSTFDLVYYPEELDALADELDDEEVDRMYYRDRQLDMKAVVLEQLNLSFPAKPLCSETCEGLCAVCGEIIQVGKCSCVVKEPETPWNALKINVKDKS